MDVNKTDEIYRHYRSVRHDAMFVAREWQTTPALFSVLKYVQRAGKKDNNSHTQDMLKAVWYLSYETASTLMPHDECVTLADMIMDNLKQAIQDYGCHTQTGASLDPSNSQAVFYYPFVEEGDSPDQA